MLKEKVYRVYDLFLMTHEGDGSTKRESANLRTPCLPIIMQEVEKRQLPFLGPVNGPEVTRWRAEAGKKSQILAYELRDVLVGANGPIGRYVDESPIFKVTGIEGFNDA